MSSLKVKFLMVQSCCIHKELHKIFKFQGQFDLEGQGQGHHFSNPSEKMLGKQFKLEGKISMWFKWFNVNSKQEIVFKKDKATLHVISKRCENTVNYSN